MTIEAATEEREMTGREAEAIELATRTFKRKRLTEPKFYGDLQRYRVFLERHGESVEVTFLPDRSPRPRNIPKEQPWLELGGGSAYGREVHFHISLRTMKIVREDYAK